MSETILPPHDQEAEENVLGILIAFPQEIPPAAAVLRPEHFYVEAHRWVYEAILACGERADTFTVSRHLEDRGRLEECGGMHFIMQLQTQFGTALDLEACAARVRRMALSRQVIGAAQAILRLGYTGALADTELVDRAQSALLAAIDCGSERSRVSLDAAADAFYADFSAVLDTGVVPGIPTGISLFDYMVGGWRPGRLTVIGALPGHGKTTLMHNTLLHAAKAGHRAAFVTLEMTEAELIEAMASNVAGVDVSPVALLHLDSRGKADARRKIADALQLIRALPLHVLYLPDASPADTVYEVKRLNAGGRPVELVAFDYVQMGRPDGLARGANREQEVANVALGLKKAAGALGAHVITGSQVNEAGETRESKAITQHADTVIYLKRDEGRPSNDRLLSLTAEFWKNRKGKTGEVALVFKKTVANIGAMETE